METKEMKDRVGYAYSLLGVKDRQRRYSITLLFLKHMRIFGLAFIITFCSQNLTLQSIYIVYSSLILVAMIGLTRPFENPRTTRLELANEFVILILYSLLTC